MGERSVLLESPCPGPIVHATMLALARRRFTAAAAAGGVEDGRNPKSLTLFLQISSSKLQASAGGRHLFFIASINHAPKQKGPSLSSIH
jgi:hypothetical protein